MLREDKDNWVEVQVRIEWFCITHSSPLTLTIETVLIINELQEFEYIARILVGDEQLYDFRNNVAHIKPYNNKQYSSSANDESFIRFATDDVL